MFEPREKNSGNTQGVKIKINLRMYKFYCFTLSDLLV